MAVIFTFLRTLCLFFIPGADVSIGSADVSVGSVDVPVGSADITGVLCLCKWTTLYRER